VLGSPKVKSATLLLPNGKKLDIQAKNQGKQNIYVQSVTWNGRPLDRAYITHDEIVQGGKLVFSLGPTINERLGALEPPSGF
jgi:putative alpha-1,2-mannosidase